MQAPDPRDDLALITDAALSAGKSALRFFQGDFERWEKDGGAGPVTEADLAVDSELESRLRAARPGYGWLSEESDAEGWQDRARIFVIDPIDGTRSFIEGSRTWAISIAVIESGHPIAAVVHLPARELTYGAAKGDGATKNGEPIAASNSSNAEEAHFLSAKINFQPERWAKPIVAPRISFRSSLAYRMALVAEGRFDAMVTLRRTWDWDVAAGTLLVTEAGGHVCLPNGKEPDFGNAERSQQGLLAGNEPLVGWMLDHGPKLPT